MNTTAIIPASNVDGNITSCKIETAQIKIDRHFAFSPTQTVTYRSYDVCTGNTINEFPIHELTPGFLIGSIILFFVFIAFKA
jgi:hypothetical protein